MSVSVERQIQEAIENLWGKEKFSYAMANRCLKKNKHC